MSSDGEDFGLKLIGSLIAIIATVVGGVVWQTSQINDLRFDMQAILHLHDTRLNAAEHKLRGLPPKDMWRRQDMFVWSRDLKDANDGLKVPDPRETLSERDREGG